MKKALSLLVLIIPLFCCNYKVTTFVIKVEKVLEYNIIMDGKKTNVTRTITRDQIMRHIPLDEDIVTRPILKIEGLEYNLKAASDNHASRATVSATATVGTMEKPLVHSTTIDIDQSGDQWQGWKTLDLSAEGVSLLQSQMTDWIDNYNTFNSIDISALAMAPPVKSGRLSVNFSLKLKVTIIYGKCYPGMVGRNDPECPALNIFYDAGK